MKKNLLFAAIISLVISACSSKTETPFLVSITYDTEITIGTTSEIIVSCNKGASQDVVLSFVSSDESVVTVTPSQTIKKGQKVFDGTVTVTTVGEGTATIAVTSSPSVKLSSDNLEVTVVPVSGPANITYTVTKQTMEVGDTAVLTIVSDIAVSSYLAINIECSNSAVLLTDELATILIGEKTVSVTVEALALGTATITLSTDSEDAVISGGEIDFEVVEEAPALSITSEYPTIAVGNTVTLTITASTTSLSDMHFEIESEDPAILTVADSSLVIPAGETSVTTTASGVSNGTVNVAIYDLLEIVEFDVASVSIIVE